MSATLSCAVRRLPVSSRLLASRSNFLFHHPANQPICLTTYGFQCQALPLYRMYANQSNNNHNGNKSPEKKEDKKPEKSDEKNKVESNSKVSEVDGFRHFFNKH